MFKGGRERKVGRCVKGEVEKVRRNRDRWVGRERGSRNAESGLSTCDLGQRYRRGDKRGRRCERSSRNLRSSDDRGDLGGRGNPCSDLGSRGNLRKRARHLLSHTAFGQLELAIVTVNRDQRARLARNDIVPLIGDRLDHDQITSRSIVHNPFNHSQLVQT
jgi:hypothetical protein